MDTNSFLKQVIVRHERRRRHRDSVPWTVYVPKQLLEILRDDAEANQRSVSRHIVYLLSTHPQVHYTDFVEVEDDL